ncbi:MAG: RnfABCDGE type electron transport complex subunit B [Acidobacteria bacterium]|nr:MAG: RnfABCDGE type electron transport complex subunit B [Acidobacteriota bacterium]
MSVTTIVVILAGATMLTLAAVMGVLLGWANRVFHVEVDPRVEKVAAVLPQANCGACGQVGCGEFAEAVVAGKAAVTACAPGGPSVAQQIAALLGVEVEQTWPYKAVLHCAADFDKRKGRMPYDGEKTCKAANVISGIQGCVYGCLGFGDCVEVCNYDALVMENGLPRVIYDNCVGCRACAEECPRNLFTMVPFKAERMLVVACANKDNGKDVKEVCEVGCIGCGVCAKVSDLLEMKDGIPEIKYDSYLPSAQLQESLDTAIEKCPMESLVYVGKPTAEDLAATAHEELPERIEDSFETTVDRTEWRG